MPLNFELSRMRTSSAVSCATSAVILAWSDVDSVPFAHWIDELADALQDRVHLVERAFRRLDERDAVLGVAAGLGGAADLGAHALRDGQAGGVVGGAVDAQAADESFSIDFDIADRGHGQVAVGVERLDVGVDAKGHSRSSLISTDEPRSASCRERLGVLARRRIHMYRHLRV